MAQPANLGGGFAGGVAGRMAEERQRRDEQAAAAAEANAAALTNWYNQTKDSVTNAQTFTTDMAKMAATIASSGEMTEEMAMQLSSIRESVKAANASVGLNLAQSGAQLMRAGLPAESVAGVPSLSDIMRNSMARFDAAVMEAYAQTPFVKGRAEAQQELAKLGALGVKITPQVRKMVAGVNQDPNIQALLHPEKGPIAFDMSTEQGLQDARKALADGAVPFSFSYAPDSPESMDLFSNTEIADLRQAEQQAWTTWQMTDHIRNQINTDQDLYTGLTGSMATWMRGAQEQIEQMNQMLGINLDPAMMTGGKFDPNKLDYDGQLGGELASLARSNRVFRFNLGRLAMMMAKEVDPNGTLSMGEVNIQLGLLGMNSGKLTVGAILDEIDTATAMRMNATGIANQRFADGPLFDEKTNARIERLLSGETDTGGEKGTIGGTTGQPQGVVMEAVKAADASDDYLNDPEVIRLYQSMTPEQKAEFGLRLREKRRASN